MPEWKLNWLVKQLLAPFLFKDEKILSGGDCNNSEFLNQFKNFILAILMNFEYLKWFILNNNDLKFI